MSIGFISNRIPNNNDYTNKNFDISGLNSGNIVFINAIKNLFKCDYVDYSDIGNTNYDSYITVYFAWIRQNEDKGEFKNYLQKVKDKKVVPLSVGLQCRDYFPEFKIHKNTVDVLMELSERCTLGVRGEYTASILAKNGIKNIQIVGCPSLYYTDNPFFSINKPKTLDKESIICNYKTLLDGIDKQDIDILTYFSRISDLFIDQTKIMISDEKYMSLPDDVRNLLNNNRKVYFTIDSWNECIRKYKFSIGARFHGNVVAILNGIPSLILYSDSRTKELSDFFGIPNIGIADFDIHKPIEYYYEKADYSLFNSRYPILYKDFCSFAKKNGLELNINI